MSRIAAKFEELKQADRKGFIPFVTAGDPDLATSLSIVLKLAELGADVIELGVPFSDPMADGPTIQRSSQRALDNGTSLAEVIHLASQVRHRSDVPLVLFSYYNPILRFGIDDFVESAAHAGIDGVLLTDVIEDEAS
ncbi:MAG: tryptophan synthase subunit alpha, partial [Acidobacteriota bacterium]